MKGTWTVISAIAVIIQRSAAKTIDIITLQTQGSTYIQEAEATLQLGDVPTPLTGDLALWSAILMDKYDFLQGISETSAEPLMCTNLGKNWCIFAYTLNGGNITSGPKGIAAPGSEVRTHYKLNSNTELWDQKVYFNDELVSSLSTSLGQRGKDFFISVEYASGQASTVDAHVWHDISITLNQADQSFRQGGDLAKGTTGFDMFTTDHGKTWMINRLSVPSTFNT